MHLLKTLNQAHFIQMYQLEQQYYADSFITPYEEAYRWYQRFPYTTFAVAAKGKVIGFINLIPIQEHVYKQITKGIFNDKDLTVADIVDIDKALSGTLPMFLSCIVVLEKWRKRGVTELLLRTAVDYYKPYASRFDVIITDSLTAEGLHFSRRYGFKPMTTSEHHSQLSIQSYDSFQKNVLGG